MSIKARLRLLHRKISPWLVPSLLLLAGTGLTYRIGRSWFGMSKETGGNVLSFHTGEFIDANVSVIYLLAVGGTLLFLIGSGFWMMMTSRKSKNKIRASHRLIATIIILPLALSAFTGIAIQLGKVWFNFDESTLKLLLSLHQGSWLGKDLRPFYILILGTGLITLCITGLRIMIRKKPTPRA